MGAWGTGIFANDTAADVREEWRDAIRDGEDPATASDRMVRLYTREAVSELWAIDFFTGLAAAQMETGRLQPAVRDRALELIAAGGDVELWAETDPVAARRRERALARLPSACAVRSRRRSGCGRAPHRPTPASIRATSCASTRRTAPAPRSSPSSTSAGAAATPSCSRSTGAAGRCPTG